MKNKNISFLTEIAIMAALALILSQIKFSGFWGQGGSVSLEMVPIFLMAFRRGVKGGIITGLLVALLSMILDPQIYYPVQVVLDYPVAFGLAGLAGLFAPSIKQSASKRSALMVTGIFVGCLLRLIAHILSGVIFFAEYAGKMNVWLYSFLYNGSYMGVIFIITSLVVVFLTNAAPVLIHRKNKEMNHAA